VRQLVRNEILPSNFCRELQRIFEKEDRFSVATEETRGAGRRMMKEELLPE
jgi:hypothetical protein